MRPGLWRGLRNLADSVRGLPTVSRLLVRTSPALLLLAIAVVMFFQSSTQLEDRACRLCHRGLSWGQEQARHSELDCSVCHREPGTIGSMDLRLRMVGMAAGRIAGRTATTAQVSSRACLTCHSEILERNSDSGGVRVSHKEPVEAGWECSACHARGFHGGASRDAGSAPMERCLRCHYLSSRLGECKVCHTGKHEGADGAVRGSSYATVHGPNWLRKHGTEDTSLCAGCHTSDRCRGCHGLSIPVATRR